MESRNEEWYREQILKFHDFGSIPYNRNGSGSGSGNASCSAQKDKGKGIARMYCQRYEKKSQ